MRVALSVGHGKFIRGASGSPCPPLLDEVDEACRLVEAIADNLRLIGVECVTFFDTTSYDQSTNLETIVSWHNAQVRDLDVSLHFNCYNGSAHGTEVLYYSQETLAAAMSAAIAAAGGFSDRGAKFRDDLYVLNNTDMPCVLIEVCFCDNTGDCNSYNANVDAIAEAIAEAISGVEVPHEPDDRPSHPERPPSDVSGANRVEIAAEATGDVSVVVNGALVHGNEGEHGVNFTVEVVGDCVLVINGEEFHNRLSARFSED